jgi:hypothetical protein
MVFRYKPTSKAASGMIKFLTGSCLSGLGLVLKEPSSINFMDEIPR